MRAALAVVLLAAVTAASAQEPEALWMPEGYRLLSLEERRELSPEQLQSIGKTNSKLLEEAVRKMTAEERQAVAARLNEYGQKGDATPVEKQYITMASMLVMALAMEEHNQQQRQAEADRVKALILEAEEKTKGFASDQKSVEQEAFAVDAERRRRGDSRALYVRILKPLRARPWNQQVRLVFRRLVQADHYRLLEPALAFVRARQKESPEEGSWQSLEAFLLLTLKDDVSEAKRLFAVAVTKEARDVESHVFPLLIAEIEGNQPDVERYSPRARKLWPKAQDLQKVLFDQISVLPLSLQRKARGTFEARYRKEHPADWSARYRKLSAMVWDDKAYDAVEREIAELLALPVSVFPEPFRLDYEFLRLRSKVARGNCREAAVGIPRLEAHAEAVYPPSFDPDVAPPPRTEADVRGMRAELAQLVTYRKQLEGWRDGGSKDLPAELSALTAGERRALLERVLAELEVQVRGASELLQGRDDVKAAVEWSRRDLEEWEKEHGVAGRSHYGIQGKAESKSISIRTATGICFLDQNDPLGAVRVLAPAAGRGRNLHSYPIGHLITAATLVAGSGHVEEAAKVYEQVRAGDFNLKELFRAIEKAAPGRVQPRPEDR